MFVAACKAWVGCSQLAAYIWLAEWTILEVFSKNQLETDPKWSCRAADPMSTASWRWARIQDAAKLSISQECLSVYPMVMKGTRWFHLFDVTQSWSSLDVSRSCSANPKNNARVASVPPCHLAPRCWASLPRTFGSSFSGMKISKTINIPHEIISCLKEQNRHARDVCTTGPVAWMYMETMSRKLQPFIEVTNYCYFVGCASASRILFLVPNHQPV